MDEKPDSFGITCTQVLCLDFSLSKLLPLTDGQRWTSVCLYVCKMHMHKKPYEQHGTLLQQEPWLWAQV